MMFGHTVNNSPQRKWVYQTPPNPAYAVAINSLFVRPQEACFVHCEKHTWCNHLQASRVQPKQTAVSSLFQKKVLQQIGITTIALSCQSYEIYRYQRWLYTVERLYNLEGDNKKQQTLWRNNTILAYKHVEQDPYDCNLVRQIPLVVTQMKKNGQR